MDFTTILPSELTEIIFGYLSVKELLEVSLVSKTWKTFIGESSNLMKNVKLVFNRLSDTMPFFSNDKRALAGSSRIYQHLEIKTVSKYNIREIYNILKFNINNIKTLKLKNLQFESTKDVADFIGQFSTTLEQIDIDGLYVTYEENYQHREFEKLKVLKLTNADCENNCSDIFIKCNGLIEYRLSSRTYKPNCVKSIVKLLTQNEKLKILELSLPAYDMILGSPAFPFKLHTFETSDTRFSTWTHENFKEFFMTQFDSLQKLSFDQVTHAEDLQIIYKMPQLKELNLGRVEKLDLKYERLSINKNLQKLAFFDMTKKLDTVNTLINASPNVKGLKIYSMTQETMEMISVALRELESLELRTIDAEELSDERLFPKLTNCSVAIIASDLEDHMEGLPVENRNAFVRLILASNYIILH